MYLKLGPQGLFDNILGLLLDSHLFVKALGTQTEPTHALMPRMRLKVFILVANKHLQVI